jgi:hypothetical protein
MTIIQRERFFIRPASASNGSVTRLISLSMD